MSEFSEGDRVRVVVGPSPGATGVVGPEVRGDVPIRVHFDEGGSCPYFPEELELVAKGPDLEDDFTPKHFEVEVTVHINGQDVAQGSAEGTIYEDSIEDVLPGAVRAARSNSYKDLVGAQKLLAVMAVPAGAAGTDHPGEVKDA